MEQKDTQPKELVVFLTGFGKFGSILENPTTKLSRAAQDLLKQNPIENVTLFKNYVITVAIEDCNEALEEIYQEIDKQLQDESNKNKSYLVMHFGVYKGCGAFRLEMQGRNIKHFFIPDERGNKPLDQCIDECCEKGSCILTCLSPENLKDTLCKEGYTCAVSDSAGQYICNYTYYQSLKKRDSLKNKERVFTLFCHVPDFDQIDEPTQQKFMLSLIKEIKNQTLSETKTCCTEERKPCDEEKKCSHEEKKCCNEEKKPAVDEEKKSQTDEEKKPQTDEEKKPTTDEEQKICSEVEKLKI